MTIITISKGNGQGHIVERYRFAFTDEFKADQALDPMIKILREVSDTATPPPRAAEENRS